MDTYVLILCTVPNREVGMCIASRLVEEKKAACVNILDKVTSIYRWKGDICTDAELLLLIKTRAELFPTVKDAIISLHPYEVPEVVQLPINAGHGPYLAWIGENTNF